MNIAFNLSLDIPFFKDLWGYKTPDIQPGIRYGFINSRVNFSNPPTRGVFLPDDIVLQQLLNNETIYVPISVSTKGVVKYDILNHPGAIALNIIGTTHDVEIKVLNYTSTFSGFFNGFNNGTANCSLRITKPIMDLAIPEGEILIIGNTYRNLQAVKLYLNNPDKYYLAQDNKFITHAPCSQEDYRRIYDAERPARSSYPTSNDIVLDPLLYTDHEFKPAAMFAKALVSENL